MILQVRKTAAVIPLKQVQVHTVEQYYIEHILMSRILNFGAICRLGRDMESASFDPPTGLTFFSEEVAQKFHFPGVELGGYTT